MRRPVLVLTLVAMLFTTAGIASSPGPAPVEAAPAAPAALPPQLVTRSYYMGNGSHAAARNLGCANGDKTGRMTLYFGAPVPIGAGYGATLWGAPNQTTAGISEIVKEFVRGYVWCRRSPNYTLFVGVGTSNSTIDSRANAWVQEHGRQWGGMATLLSAWANTHYPGRVRLYGGWDAEPGWSKFEKADLWIRGYDSVRGRPGLHANHSADGCPQDRANNGSCNNGWNQQRVWRVSWEWAPALPIPQIYATSGANARQWHMLNLYGANRGDGMYFYGAMAQNAACRRVSGGCRGTDNTADRAHDLLLWFNNTRAATRQDRVDSPTDIDWHY